MKKHHSHHGHHGHHGHHADAINHEHPRHHIAREHASHSMYRHEMDRPHEAAHAHGHPDKDLGLGDMKAQAASIAMGQAGPQGCKSDEKKWHSQFKEYHWDGGTSGY